MKQDLLNMTIDEMQEFAAELGERPFRGKQLFQWIYSARFPGSFHEMSNLPKSFREKLMERATIGRVTVEEAQQDSADGTIKFLFRLADLPAAKDETSGLERTDEPCGRTDFVEGVFMKYRYGNTLCLSTQIGCRMGCVFCASSRGGFVRDLTPGEMTGQLLTAEKHTEERIDHIVLMGMGEPFDNYENVSSFLRLIHDSRGRNMSYRNMTVSTSGLIPGIVAFAEDFPQANLAISLHRSDDWSRSRLMPVNRKYPIAELLKAAREYTETTHRRITFEYALVAGENDGDDDARDLARLLKGMLCHVNLIPLNPVRDTGLKGSSRARAVAFAGVLNECGIPATVRRQLGSDIDGACGQLRLRNIEEAADSGK